MIDVKFPEPEISSRYEVRDGKLYLRDSDEVYIKNKVSESDLAGFVLPLALTGIRLIQYCEAESVSNPALIKEASPYLEGASIIGEAKGYGGYKDAGVEGISVIGTKREPRINFYIRMRPRNLEDLEKLNTRRKEKFPDHFTTGWLVSLYSPQIEIYLPQKVFDAILASYRNNAFEHLSIRLTIDGWIREQDQFLSSRLLFVQEAPTAGYVLDLHWSERALPLNIGSMKYIEPKDQHYESIIGKEWKRLPKYLQIIFLAICMCVMIHILKYN